MSENPSYFLEVKVSGKENRRFELNDKSTFGTSDQCDIKIDAVGVAPIHCSFRVQEDILCLHHLAEGYALVLDKQELEYGRIYILDRGDKLKIGDCETIVRKEEVVTAKKVKKAIAETEDEDDDEENKSSKTNSKLTTIKTKEKTPSNEMHTVKTSLTSLMKKAKNEDENDDHDVEEENDDEAENGEESSSKKGLLSKLKGPSKEGFFARFFKKKSPSSKIKKKFSFKSYATPPGFGLRFFSLIFDASLIYCLKYFALPFFELETLCQQYITKLIPYLDKGLEKLVPFVQKYFLEFKIPITIPSTLPHFIHEEFFNYDFLLIMMGFVAIQMSAHLLTGTSYGLYILGVSHNGNFLAARIKGLIRCFIGLFTGPLIIFDVPVVFGFRSFKEIITFSELSTQSNVQKYLGLFFFLPLLTLAALISPVFFSLDDLHGHNVNISTISDRPLPEGKIPDFQGPFSPLGQKFESLLGEEVFSNTRFSLFEEKMPETTNKKNAVTKKFKALYSFYFVDISKKNSIEVEYNLFPDIRKIVLSLDQGDPLLLLVSPGLKDVFNQQHFMPTNSQTQEQLVTLIKNALSLGLETFPEIAIHHGPFINGMLTFRRELFKQLEINKMTELELTKIAGGDYLVIENNPDANNTVRHYINIDFRTPPSWHFKIKYRTANAAMAKSLIQKFLRGIKKWDKNESENKEVNQAMTHSLNEVEVYRKMVEGKAPEESHYIQWNQYLLQTGSKILETGDKTLAMNFARHLGELEKSFTQLQEMGHTYAAPWAQQAQKIASALKNSDQAFFGMSPK